MRTEGREAEDIPLRPRRLCLRGRSRDRIERRGGQPCGSHRPGPVRRPRPGGLESPERRTQWHPPASIHVLGLLCLATWLSGGGGGEEGPTIQSSGGITGGPYGLGVSLGKRNCGCRQEQSELNDKDRVGTEQKSDFFFRRNKEKKQRGETRRGRKVGEGGRSGGVGGWRLSGCLQLRSGEGRARNQGYGGRIGDSYLNWCIIWKGQGDGQGVLCVCERERERERCQRERMERIKNEERSEE